MGWAGVGGVWVAAPEWVGVWAVGARVGGGGGAIGKTKKIPLNGQLSLEHALKVFSKKSSSGLCHHLIRHSRPLCRNLCGIP